MGGEEFRFSRFSSVVTPMGMANGGGLCHRLRWMDARISGVAVLLIIENSLGLIGTKYKTCHQLSHALVPKARYECTMQINSRYKNRKESTSAGNIENKIDTILKFYSRESRRLMAQTTRNRPRMFLWWVLLIETFIRSFFSQNLTFQGHCAGRLNEQSCSLLTLYVNSQNIFY